MMRLRDRNLLEHIQEYCNEVEISTQRFGPSFDIFQNDQDYQRSVAMSIMQIGELVGNFTEEFIYEHKEKPWHEMRGMRNVVAHKYGQLDKETLWETAVNDIPDLKEYCETLLNREIEEEETMDVKDFDPPEETGPRP